MELQRRWSKRFASALANATNTASLLHRRRERVERGHKKLTLDDAHATVMPFVEDREV